jgi:hypothetical protein
MDGSIASGRSLMRGLTERDADLQRLIAAERERARPDEMLIRRLTRERLLAKDRLAALAGCGMPRWAREDGGTAD